MCIRNFVGTRTPASYTRILTNCPAFRGTVPIFGPKFVAVLLFFSLFHIFLPIFNWALIINLSLNLIIVSYFCQICKNVPLLDQKSHFFRKFVPLFASGRLADIAPSAPAAPIRIHACMLPICKVNCTL